MSITKTNPNTRIRETHPELPGIEFKTGRGRQVLAAGSLHPNGNYYERDDCSPDLKDATPLHELLLNLIRRPEGGALYNIEDAKMPVEMAERILDEIDPADYCPDNDSWFAICASALGAAGPDAIPVLIEWSQRDENFVGDEGAAARIESLVPDAGSPALGIGTFFKIAKECGVDVEPCMRELDLAMLPDEDDPDDVDAQFEPPQRPGHEVIRLRALSSIAPERVGWIWKGYLPKQMLSINTGDPESGKTAVSYDILARLTRGDPMPLSEERQPPGSVLIIACEDSLEHVVVPRLTVAGADLDRVKVLDGNWNIQALNVLEDAMEKVKPKVVYLDALFATMASVDAHRDNEVRGPLQALMRLVASHGATLWTTRHTRKSRGPTAVHAGMASVAFTAVARSEMFFNVNPDVPDGEFVMAHSKCNVGPKAPSLRYRIDVAELPELPGSRWPLVEWLGESPYTANQLSAWTPDNDRQAGRPANELLGAMGWLEEYLRNRGEPVPPREAKEDGAEADHNSRTLQRAVGASELIETVGYGPARRWLYIGADFQGAA